MIRMLALLPLLTTAAALAEPSGPRLETLVVTASRTPVPLKRTGSAVSVLTRSDIDAHQAATLAGLLREVPGIAISQSGSLGAQTQLRMRGGEANHVLVLIDGVEANDPAIGGEFQFEHLLTDDIEKVEIVRGPQSALWGSDAVSGVINIITKRSSKGLSASGRVDGGSFATTHAGARVSYGGEAFGIAADAAYLDTAGTNISRSGSEKDGYRDDTLDLTAHLSPRQSRHFDFFARQTDSAKQLDAVDPATGLPADADRLTDATERYLRAGATFTPSPLLTQNIKATWLGTATRNFADGAPNGDYAAGKTGLYYQAELALPGALAQTLMLAADTEHLTFRRHGTATAYGDPNQTQHMSTAGYVAEYRVSPGERFDLSAAVRYDTSSEFRSVTTYRLSASYLRSASGTHIRANIGTGQKAPTFIERFGYFPNVFLGNPKLEPETSRGWDVGVDQALAGASLSVGATFFYQHLEHEIDGFVFDTAAGQYTAVNGAGISHRKGVELALTAAPAAGLTVRASYTYTHSTQPDAAGRQQPEVRRPRDTAAIDVGYAPSAKIHLDADVTFVGSRYDTFFAPYPLPAQRRRLGGYRLVGLAGSYKITPRVELVGRIDNVLDARYEDVIGYATPGRAIHVGVRVGR